MTDLKKDAFQWNSQPNGSRHEFGYFDGAGFIPLGSVSSQLAGDGEPRDDAFCVSFIGVGSDWPHFDFEGTEAQAKEFVEGKIAEWVVTFVSAALDQFNVVMRAAAKLAKAKELPS